MMKVTSLYVFAIKLFLQVALGICLCLYLYLYLYHLNAPLFKKWKRTEIGDETLATRFIRGPQCCNLLTVSSELELVGARFTPILRLFKEFCIYIL